MGRLSTMKEELRRVFGRRPAAAPDRRPWWDENAFESPWPGATVVEHVVDNRVFLLGLDELYRNAVKKHEQGELLACARRVASVLNVLPAVVPIEGYYTEHPDLTAYFRLMRALQQVPLKRAIEVESLPEFRRLLAVTSSPIFGPAVRTELLPNGKDPLAAALLDVKQWTVPTLTAAAAAIARHTGDYSLVGLAARSEDAVVLAALRESVVLYAEQVLGAAPTWPKFVWRVDAHLSAAAPRFVDEFNALFGRELPPATGKYAEAFGCGGDQSRLVGGCVRLGHIVGSPTRFYHWAIDRGPDGRFEVSEFWAPEIWTTERYRSRYVPGRDSRPGQTARRLM